MIVIRFGLDGVGQIFIHCQTNEWGYGFLNHCSGFSWLFLLWDTYKKSFLWTKPSFFYCWFGDRFWQILVSRFLLWADANEGERNKNSVCSGAKIAGNKLSCQEVSSKLRSKLSQSFCIASCLKCNGRCFYCSNIVSSFLGDMMLTLSRALSFRWVSCCDVAVFVVLYICFIMISKTSELFTHFNECILAYLSFM